MLSSNNIYFTIKLKKRKVVDSSDDEFDIDIPEKRSRTTNCLFEDEAIEDNNLSNPSSECSEVVDDPTVSPIKATTPTEPTTANLSNTDSEHTPQEPQPQKPSPPASFQHLSKQNQMNHQSPSTFQNPINPQLHNTHLPTSPNQTSPTEPQQQDQPPAAPISSPCLSNVPFSNSANLNIRITPKLTPTRPTTQ